MKKALLKYESNDSIVLLDRHAEAGDSKPPSSIGTPQADHYSEAQSKPAQAFSVGVRIRFGRLLLVTIVAAGGIVALTLVFSQGLEVSRFEASTKTAAQQQKLLNNYNSYSGNLSSVFGRPIELLVPVLMQIFMLRFMAAAMTQRETTMTQSALTLALSALVSYLISNGFNAVNVQLRPQDVQPVISTSDLSVASTLNDTFSVGTTTVERTVSELTPGNPITNTVLRNAVVSRVTRKGDLCDWKETEYENYFHNTPLPTVNYGFTQRDWQSRLLQQAPEPTTFHVVINSTDKSGKTTVGNSADLPMNASTAADLFLYAMAIGPNLFPWGEIGDFVDADKFSTRFPKGSKPDPNYVDSAARREELLPRRADAEETAQREWFLKELPAAMTRQLKKAVNTSRSDVGIEFSRVNITPEIVFDAVTIEFELDPTLLATASKNNNATRLTALGDRNTPGSATNCGPWPALCYAPKNAYTGLKPAWYAIDAPPVVHAFSACMNADRTLELRWRVYDSPDFSCNESSDSAMMIYSVGKRLVASSLEQNKSAESETQTGSALITNLRKIYTFTVGRLSWQLANLSSSFEADCSMTGTTTSCMGLQVPLSTTTLQSDDSHVETKDQRLVVSADALPTNVLLPSELLSYYKQRSIPLVEVNELPSLYQANELAGDVLLPHNARKVVWSNETRRGGDCEIEAHLFTRLNNHLYIEHSLQAAYTAGTFFLLQDAVARDTIVLSSNATTLAFSNNRQDVVLWVSTPFQNMLLTVAGCALLVFGLLVTALKSAFWSPAETDPLHAITTPQAIARVMLDDKQFPSLLLDRSVIEESREPRKIEEFYVAGVTVEHTEERSHLTATPY